MYPNRMKTLGNCMIALGGILIVLALSLVVYNFWEDLQAKQSSEDIICKLPIINNEVDIPLYETNPEMEMPAVEINGNLYIGRIEFPTLNISLPVMKEWSYPRLKIAPCRYSGSAYKDNMVIIAHNYKSHFGNLKTLMSEEPVIFTDVDGNVFRYKVAEIDELQPTDIDKVTVENRDLTLMTCTIDSKCRVTVRCIKE